MYSFEEVFYPNYAKVQAVNNQLAFPLALSSELKKSDMIRVTFKGKPLVLLRLEHSIKAFLDRCPHRGYPLSKGCIKGNNIVCSYHGWAFDSDGRLVDLPGDPNFLSGSSSLLQEFKVVEKDGVIWGSESAIDIEEVFTPSVKGTHDRASIVRYIRANKVDIAENFLDALHTHTVHTGIVRSSRPKHRCSVLVESIENGYQAEYTEEDTQTGFLGKLFGGKVLKSIGRIRYPGIIEIEYLSKNDIEMSVVVYIVEESKYLCKLIMRTYLKKTRVPFLMKALLLAPIQLMVFNQDKRVLERQAESLKRNSDFRPLIGRADVMRSCIEKTFAQEFVAYKKNIELCL
ncbi:Rieske 2Fe-2S domain-containing protein [Microbulbifer sp. CNSA002]|uniref:Rieske 2Fe-2S domain-containing protein n=1 Tax=Microbulbifer sp. CNSA002 TaxID=3373604 RepID=UPI0039B62710